MSILSGALDETTVCVTVSDSTNAADVRAARTVSSARSIRHNVFSVTVALLRQHFVRILLSMAGLGPAYSAYMIGLAARHVIPGAKVLLCGEGADEVFLGYWMHREPSKFADQAVASLSEVAPSLVDASPMLQVVAAWRRGVRSSVDADVADLFRRHQLVSNHLLPFDHGLMAHGIECRVPYVDADLVHWAGSLPMAVHHSDAHNQGKALIRELASEFMAGVPGADQIFLRREKLAALHAVAGARQEMMNQLRKLIPGSRLSQSNLARFVNSAEELIWFGATHWLLFECTERGHDDIHFEEVIRRVLASSPDAPEVA
jgi:asparagine synthetase B (glutamine-hydrolysing)